MALLRVRDSFAEIQNLEAPTKGELLASVQEETVYMSLGHDVNGDFLGFQRLSDVEVVSALPVTGIQDKIYIVLTDSSMHYWNGTEFVPLAGIGGGGSVEQDGIIIEEGSVVETPENIGKYFLIGNQLVKYVGGDANELSLPKAAGATSDIHNFTHEGVTQTLTFSGNDLYAGTSYSPFRAFDNVYQNHDDFWTKTSTGTESFWQVESTLPFDIGKFVLDWYYGSAVPTKVHVQLKLNGVWEEVSVFENLTEGDFVLTDVGNSIQSKRKTFNLPQVYTEATGFRFSVPNGFVANNTLAIKEFSFYGSNPIELIGYLPKTDSVGGGESVDLAPLQGEVDALETRVGTVETSVSGNTSAISGHETRLDTVEGDVDAVETRVTTLENAPAPTFTQEGIIIEENDTVEEGRYVLAGNVLKKFTGGNHLFPAMTANPHTYNEGGVDKWVSVNGSAASINTSSQYNILNLMDGDFSEAYDRRYLTASNTTVKTFDVNSSHPFTVKKVKFYHTNNQRFNNLSVFYYNNGWQNTNAVIGATVYNETTYHYETEVVLPTAVSSTNFQFYFAQDGQTITLSIYEMEIFGNPYEEVGLLASKEQIITDCTGTTKPASPFANQKIFNLDTNKFEIYKNGAWVVI